MGHPMSKKGFRKRGDKMLRNFKEHRRFEEQPIKPSPIDEEEEFVGDGEEWIDEEEDDKEGKEWMNQGF